MTAPEFARPHRLDQIGTGESRVQVHAEPEELAALARRFALPAIESLEASYVLHRDAAGVLARGHLSARVTQSCTVTGAPLAAAIEEDFDLRFVPESDDAESQDEVELDAEDMDTVFYTGSAIDLGEAAAETLALALDPFPRSPEAADVLRQAGVITEEEAGPFGALASLKERLAKND